MAGSRIPQTGDDIAQAGAILTIDLGAVRENYRRLCARLPRADCAAVVKADGYGLGAASRTALCEEGCPPSLSRICRGHWRFGAPSAPSPRSLSSTGSSRGRGGSAANGPRRRHQQRRAAGGLARGAAAAGRCQPRCRSTAACRGSACRLRRSTRRDDPASFDGLDLRLVMSHLACADEPALRPTRRSAWRSHACGPAAAGTGLAVANSSGIFLGTDYHFDLARPGAALYGVNPMPGRANPMCQVVRLQAKDHPDAPISTPARRRLRPCLPCAGELGVATISLGYADGWPRRAATAAWADGRRLPFVGRVSMDSIVLDISALPAGRLAAGDLVEHDRPAANDR